jgi:membrane fusion protein, multidrug efflux system
MEDISKTDTGSSRSQTHSDGAQHAVQRHNSAAAVAAAAEHGQPGASTGAASSPAGATAPSAAPPPAHASSLRRIVTIAVVVLVLAAAAYVLVPYVILSFKTVSTDDAYVNGHVTFVAPRVPGQVVSVFVDDNYRVQKGQRLVTLDKKPYEIIVDLKRAAYDVAKANLTVAQDDFRGMIGKARSARFLLQHTIEDVDDQIALLRANVAKLNRADADYKRALAQRQTPGAISEQEVDQFKATYLVALEQVYQNRVSLGLPMKPEKGDLSTVPENLNQTFSTVRQAVANLQQAAAPLGIIAKSYNFTPKELIDEFYNLDPSHNVDVIFNQLAEKAPTVKLAEANMHQAKADLDQAELNLSYCDVYAEIDGVVTSRNVNPGNNVVVGQSLMAVRSLTEIWIDANFKETQLASLRIGQSVDLDVDMYGSRHRFKGRISGFEMGTGSTLALLPAENATGNFVKVVQRLPVRIELIKYNPDDVPLFIGLSVTPYVHIYEEPTGPDAGKVLQLLQSDAEPAKPHDSGAGNKPDKPPPPSDSAVEKPGAAAKPEAKPPLTGAAQPAKPPPLTSGATGKAEKKS